MIRLVCVPAVSKQMPPVASGLNGRAPLVDLIKRVLGPHSFHISGDGSHGLRRPFTAQQWRPVLLRRTARWFRMSTPAVSPAAYFVTPQRTLYKQHLMFAPTFWTISSPLHICIPQASLPSLQRAGSVAGAETTRTISHRQAPRHGSTRARKRPWSAEAILAT